MGEGWWMGRCSSLVGLKGGGRRGVIQCGICYGSVAMEEGGGFFGCAVTLPPPP